MGQILHFKSKFLKSISYWKQILESNKFVEKAVGNFTQVTFLEGQKKEIRLTDKYLQKNPTSVDPCCFCVFHNRSVD